MNDLLEDIKMRAIWWSWFNPFLKPQRLRKNMELMGISFKAAQQKYPNLTFTPFKTEGIECELIAPKSPLDKTLLYVHGGGYFMGSIQSYRQFLARMAYRLNVKVIAFNYRLAPENQFPDAMEDALKIATAIGKKNGSYYMAGDSAGGGLTLSTLFKLREKGLKLPEKVLCISPWLDLTLSGFSISKNKFKDTIFSPIHLRKFQTLYNGRASLADPNISPLFGDLHDLPPISIHVGENELLLSDSTRIHQRAINEGRNITLKVWPNMQHDFPIQQPRLKESKEFMQDMKEFFGFETKTLH